MTDFDTRVGAYAVIVRDDQVLLALWNEASRPMWTLPGGGVELEETAAEGAVREVREETGYDVVLDDLIGVDSGVVPAERRFVETDRPLKAVRILYTAHVVGGELRDEVDGTTDEARWWPLSEVAALPQVAMVARALAMRAEKSVDDAPG